MKSNVMKSMMLLLLAVLLAGTGCSKIKQINLDSYKIKSVVPDGLKNVDMVINIVVDNPAALHFTVDSPVVEVYRKGSHIGTFTTEPITVAAKSKDSQDVKGHITLENGQTIPKVLPYLLNFKPEDYTLNIDTVVRLKSGLHKRIVMKQVEVNDLIKK
ncbi:MAG: hypothetical protein MJY67_05575 [Bacteroidales bacterium]|nr:hypothetical protein [Bacteroidales bacterium]